jgi:hypothetical protein
VRVVGNSDVTTKVRNQPLKIDQVFFASKSFFNIFTYPLIAGDKNNALKKSSFPENVSALLTFPPSDTFLPRQLHLSYVRVFVAILSFYQE